MAQEGGGGWGGGWGSWFNPSALAEKANQLVAALVEEEDDPGSNPTTKPPSAATDDTVGATSPTTAVGGPDDGGEASGQSSAIVDEEVPSIWAAYDFINRMIEVGSEDIKEFGKSAQSMLDTVSESETYKKGVDLSFSTLEAVGRVAAEALDIEVEDSRSVEPESQATAVSTIPTTTTTTTTTQPDVADQVRGKAEEQKQGTSSSHSSPQVTAQKAAESKQPSKPSKPTFETHFANHKGTEHLQALEDISTRSLAAIQHVGSAIKMRYITDLEKIQRSFEEEEEQEEEEVVEEDDDEEKESDGDNDEEKTSAVTPRKEESKPGLATPELDRLRKELSLGGYVYCAPTFGFSSPDHACVFLFFPI
eukprot:TRINITY_DN1546_c1_g1_i1.p1 TRINITY_DN1546_c1_g1~~TRINITY_DN1546_c1_g1_i1.p1  ORF type:complete len:364 (-),score=102.77 TRINITY_DN1546_c1_g1_i1:768-1859(-)